MPVSALNFNVLIIYNYTRDCWSKTLRNEQEKTKPNQTKSPTDSNDRTIFYALQKHNTTLKAKKVALLKEMVTDKTYSIWQKPDLQNHYPSTFFHFFWRIAAHETSQC